MLSGIELMLNLCLDVLDNSTQKCDFLRMYYKGMFGLI